MSDLVTNLNTLTTKVAALRTKAKNKATELDSSVVIANTDTISDIVGNFIVSVLYPAVALSKLYVSKLSTKLCLFSSEP